VSQFLEPLLQFLNNRPKKPITQYSKNRPIWSPYLEHISTCWPEPEPKVDQSDKDRFKRPGTDVLILEIFSPKKY
jgi:hypothetical protein